MGSGSVRRTNAERSGIWMHQAASVQNGVLIGIIPCSGLYQVFHQSRLSTEAQARNHDCLSVPLDYAGMDEYSARRPFCHSELQVRFERVEHRLKFNRSRDPCGVRIHDVIALNSGFRTVAADYDRIEMVYELGLYRFPSGW